MDINWNPSKALDVNWNSRFLKPWLLLLLPDLELIASFKHNWISALISFQLSSCSNSKDDWKCWHREVYMCPKSRWEMFPYCCTPISYQCCQKRWWAKDECASDIKTASLGKRWVQQISMKLMKWWRFRKCDICTRFEIYGHVSLSYDLFTEIW